MFLLRAKIRNLTERREFSTNLLASNWLLPKLSAAFYADREITNALHFGIVESRWIIEIVDCHIGHVKAPEQLFPNGDRRHTEYAQGNCLVRIRSQY